MNNITIQHKSQQKEQQSSLFISTLSSYHKVSLNILSVLIRSRSKGALVDPTQAQLAEQAGTDRTYVNKVCMQMERDGILHMRRRYDYEGWQISHAYTLNKLFFDLDIRKHISHLFISCTFIPLVALLSQKCTPINNNDMYYYTVPPNINSQQGENADSFLQKLTKKRNLGKIEPDGRSPEGIFDRQRSYIGYRNPLFDMSGERSDYRPEWAQPPTIESKRDVMMEIYFSVEELKELHKFSFEAFRYAKKMLHKDLEAGKIISNHFNYFKGICHVFEAAAEKEDNPYTFKKTTITESNWEDHVMDTFLKIEEQRRKGLCHGYP